MKYYLGVDASTQKIGLAILNEDLEIIHSSCLKLKSTDSLEKRAAIFRDKLKEITKGKKIQKVFVEEAYVSFQGGSNAKTVAILQAFNGICRYLIYSILKKEAILLNPNRVRSTLGIKMVRGAKNQHEKKAPAINFVTEHYKNSTTPFKYDLTNFGNPKPGVDDRSDSICLVLAGLKL